MKIKSILAALLAALMLAGCGANETVEVDNEKLKNASYPLETDETLTWWSVASIAQGEWSAEEGVPIYRAWQEATGVEIDWITPSKGQEAQQFNIMLASGELCDIIDWYWADYAGGPDKAIEDGAILKLNDIIKDYSPNFAKYLEDNEYIAKRAKTDAGNYYYYPGTVEYGGEKDKLRVTAGFMFRADWLEKYNLEIPETIDDWYNVLTTFKQNGVESPLCIGAKDAGRGIVNAFDAPMGWYVDNGQVKYGPMQPQYKEFLATMNKWYKEGLLDANTTSIDSKTIDAKLLNNQAGAVFGWIGSGMAKWLNAAKDVNPELDLVGVPYPVKNRGDRVKFATKDAVVYSRGPAITTGCKNPYLAAKLLDFGYTEEGDILFNYGIEGKTHEVKDGKRIYTDLITNNPDGLTLDEAMSAYTYAAGKGPYVQRLATMEQRYVMPQQQAAQQRWFDTDIDLYAMPALSPTSEEASELSSIMNDVTTYVDEMYFKFLMGKEPVEKFDEYVAQIEKYNIKRAIEINQAAYERFEKR